MPVLTSDTVTGLPRRAAAPNPQTGLPGGSFPTPRVGGVPVLQPAPTLGSGSFPTPTVNGAPVLQPPSPSAPAQPDYQGLITSDPIYQQTQADIAAARAAGQSTLDAQRQRALIDFGGVPDLSGSSALIGDLGGSITDTVRQLAQANTTAGMSTQARISKANADAVKAAKDNLTARGLLSSGETGYQLGQQEQSYQQANYDAVQKLLDYLTGIQGDYMSADAQRRASLAQAASDAAGRIQAPQAPVAGGGAGAGGNGNTIILTPAQQQQIANNQFPTLDFPTAPPASSITPIGSIPLSPGQRRQVDAGRFPTLDFPQPADTIPLTPAQQQDVQNNDYPELTFPEAPPASSIDPVGTIPLTPQQQQQIANNQYPILQFPPPVAPPPLVGHPRTPGTSGARPLY